MRIRITRSFLNWSRQRRDELQERFEGRLVLATGCDFHLSFENLREIRHDASRFTLNQKNYLLVEFADYSIPPSMDQSLHIASGGIASDHHAPGAESLDTGEAGEIVSLAAAGMLRAGDRAIVAGEIREGGAGNGGRVDRDERGAFCGERRA